MALVARTCLPVLEASQTRVLSLGRADPLEEEMATCSSVLAWKIPWTEEPGRLPSMGHKESDTTEHARTRLTFRSRFFNLSSCLVSWVKSSALSLIHSFSFKLFLV